MRRVISILVMVAASTMAFTTLSAGTAVAKSDGHNMDDMGHGSGSTTKNRAVVAGARKIPVAANALKFTPKEISVTARENVTIVLSAGDLAHDFYVKSIGHVVHAKKGKTASGGLRIKKPGTYKFWCTITGHKSGGMVGTITVTP